MGEERKGKGGRIKMGPMILLLIVVGPGCFPVVMDLVSMVTGNGGQLSYYIGMFTTALRINEWFVSSEKAALKDRLTKYYEKHAPEKVSTIGDIMKKWEGKEEKLFDTLK